MKNLLVAKILNEIADMLEMQNVQFKPQAYRRAARTVESLSEPIENILAEGKLEDLPGIGPSIAKKIAEIIETGSSKYHEDLKKTSQVDIEELTSVQGVGPKTVRLLYKRLGVKTLEQLEDAAKRHKIRNIKGLGPKTEQNIVEGIELAKKKKNRVLLGFALPIAENIKQQLQHTMAAEVKIELAGSLRRMRETIGDIDILATSAEPRVLADAFTGLSDVRRVLEKGETKCSVVLKDDVQVDLRIVEDKSFGSALMYFTGSKDHNIALRKIAISKECKLNEYGLFRGEEQIAGPTEEGVYEKLGLAYIPPEIREDHGEVEAAKSSKLPNLLAFNAIKGDLQVHTNWSDGVQTIEEMAQAARELGYSYVAITDHYSQMKIANGMDAERLRKQGKEIDRLNETFSGIRVLKGAEVDIAPDGTLDVLKEPLRELDVVVGSIHSSFKQTKKVMTDRLVAAMESGYVNIIGHPTSRKINEKRPCEIDLGRLFEASQRTNTFLEINSQPERLDLSDADARLALEADCRLSIDTDAHNKRHLNFMRFGVGVARRAWSEKDDIINTLPIDELIRTLRK